MRDKFYNYIKKLQIEITSEFEKIDDSSSFSNDKWFYNKGTGGGITKIIENGKLFEKGGVNISSIGGKLPKDIIKQFKVKYDLFNAYGLSLVLHPYNPFVPTIHMNIRLFELLNEKGSVVDSWFGGGVDLTPYYIFKEDITFFHHNYKIICDEFDTKIYSEFKKKCDSYFWNSHRNEARGVGGLFFDYLRENNKHSLLDWYKYIKKFGSTFLPTYLNILLKRMNTNFNKSHKLWQEIRRGRYVEFNLVHDKGTLFGLKTGGRIESILMSLPPKVRWNYNFKPAPRSKEDELVKILKKPVDWIKIK